MSKEQDNKAIVGRWFTEFWGNPWNPKVVDELAAPDILLQYSLHAPRRGDGERYEKQHQQEIDDLARLRRAHGREHRDPPRRDCGPLSLYAW